MRFFRHGDVLAIVLPESLRKRLGVKDGDEYDFFEVENGLLALADKNKLSLVLKDRVKEKAEIKPPVQRDELKEKGYLIIANEAEAKEFSARKEKEIKSGEIKGVRGFDKKFYLLSRGFFEANHDKLIKILKEKNCNADDVAEALKTRPEAATALLCLLNEDGEIIEKKKGVYALVK